MGKLNSGRVQRTPQTGITSDRYQFLGLEQAEPNLGDPLVGPSSVGANPIPIGSYYQLAAIGENPGERYWTTQVGIGTTLGIVTVYSNGFLPNNAFGRIHGLNFVGAGVTVEVPTVDFIGDVGIATIRVAVNDILNRGDVGRILFNTSSGFVEGALDFYYNQTTGNVGIGSTLPSVKLDVNGNSHISGNLTVEEEVTSKNIQIQENLNVSGISTLGTLKISSGIVTASSGIITYYGEYYGIFRGTLDPVVILEKANYAIVSGVSTYAINSGVSTYANVSGVSTYANVSGISTVSQGLTGTPNIVVGVVTATEYYGIFKGTLDPEITLEYANKSGISTNVIGGIGSLSSLNVSGISTLDGVKISSGIITATSGIVTYYGDGSKLTGISVDSYWVKNSAGIHTLSNVGIGTTNPTQSLDINGNLRIRGGLYDSNNQVGVAGSVLISTGVGVSWSSSSSGTLSIVDNVSSNLTFYVGIASTTIGNLSTLNVSSTKLQFNPSTGNLSATVFTSLSDETQKTNIRPIENALDLVKKMNGVRYDWKNDHNQSSIGVIAQEIEKIIPEVISTNDKGLKTVSYGNLIAVLIEAIKEQQIRIEKLENKGQH